jgi:hypothetical protein
MIDDLHRIGWKAFQDLCLAIAAEVLKRPIQSFLASNDGGRDGAFLGAWEGGEGVAAGKSTIQIKHFGSASARLSLSHLAKELGKAKELAAQGLAGDYIVITNAGVSGAAEASICQAFEKVGVQRCRVFGGDWVATQLRSRPSLRMLIPRIYNLADLGQFIDGRAYLQARHLLSAMGDDLRCFVTTDAHRRSVEVLLDHRFVLLLGDPASGKSTIAAILSLGALDGGAEGAVRITSPDQLDRWNPDIQQVLWVDDAFGSNQVEAAKVDGWNSQLPMLRAVVKSGTNVIFTSRNYIWEGARRSLRTSQFPLLRESQVVIDVQGLSEIERAQILYNHIRLGNQPAEMRRRLKPFLATAATATNFLPETARRLGASEFTKRLEVTAKGVIDFVEHPLEFLREVIERLDRSSSAAIALIFLHGTRGVPSPIPDSEALATVTRLTGVAASDIARSLEEMRQSLTLLVEHEEGDRWTFRHPTIADAYSMIVANGPEFVEIYLHGAKLERLLADVFCGRRSEVYGAKVRVPSSLYGVLTDRLSDVPIDSVLHYFLAERCDEAFLRAFVEARPEIWQGLLRLHIPMADSNNIRLLARFNEIGLLSEENVETLVKEIRENTLEWFDASIFQDRRVRSLLPVDEFERLCSDVKSEWLADLDASVDRMRGGYSSSDQAGMYRDFRDSLEAAAKYFSDDDELQSALPTVLRRIEEMISEEEEQPSHRRSGASESSPNVSGALTEIFSDVDEE